MENKSEVQELFNLGNEKFIKYLKSQDLCIASEAKKIYEKLAMDFICPSVYNNLGVLYCETGSFHEAISQYELIPDSEKNAENWYNLAVALYWSGDYQEGLEIIKKICSDDLQFPEAIAMKGKIEIELNQYAEASESFSKAFSIDNDSKYLIWDGYSCYLNAELLVGKNTSKTAEYKNSLTTVIRKLEKAKTVASKRENKIYHSGTLLFLGCFYARHDDLLSAKENLIECADNCDDSILKSKATELLSLIWERGIRPSWYTWWTNSPKALAGKWKKLLFFTSIILLLILSMALVLHPILNDNFKHLINWNLYVFIIGFVFLILISPSATKIKTSQFEVELHIPHPLEGVPAPAKLESALRGLRRAANKH